MDLHGAALVIAGIVGSTVAIVHGVVTQRVMVRPVHELTAGKLPQSIRRLVAALLHFSTFNWFVSGLALLIAVYSFGGKRGWRRTCWSEALIFTQRSATYGRPEAAMWVGFSIPSPSFS